MNTYLLTILFLAFDLVKNHPWDDHKSWQLLPTPCGREASTRGPTLKMQGGIVARQGQFPWMVNLFYSGFDYHTQNPQCGGAVLNEKYVLTAAHCCNLTDKKPIIVRVGEHDFRDSQDCNDVTRCNDRVQDVKVDSVKIHPDYTVRYKFGDAHNDICLVRVKDRISVNQYVEPICLPRGKDALIDKPGKIMKFSGWGRYGKERVSTVLRTMSVTVISPDECDKRLPVELKHNRSIELCALGIGQKFCHGDSGGPLVYNVRAEQYSVYGIASYSTEGMTDPECKDDSPMVFADVTKHLGWILDNIKA